MGNNTEAFDLGILLKKLREELNYSQDYVADKLGLTRSAISSYEQGINSPSYDALKKLALLFNVSGNTLLGFDEDEAIYLDDFSLEQKKAIRKILAAIKEGLKF